MLSRLREKWARVVVALIVYRDNHPQMASDPAASGTTDATAPSVDKKAYALAMACWHVLTVVPGSERPHTYSWASVGHSHVASGFGGGHTWSALCYRGIAARACGTHVAYGSGAAMPGSFTER